MMSEAYEKFKTEKLVIEGQRKEIAALNQRLDLWRRSKLYVIWLEGPDSPYQELKDLGELG